MVAGLLPPSKHNKQQRQLSACLNPTPYPNSSKARRHGPARHTPQGRSCRLGPTGTGICEGNGGPTRRGRSVRETARGDVRTPPFGQGRKQRETSTAGPPHEAECEAARASLLGNCEPFQPGLCLTAGHTRRRRATSQAARDERASAAGVATEARTRVAVGGGVSTLASAPTPGRGRRERCCVTAGDST